MILEDREMAQIEQLRAALAGDVDADRRFRAATLLAGLLGHRLRAADAADVLEDQLEAFAALGLRPAARDRGGARQRHSHRPGHAGARGRRDRPAARPGRRRRGNVTPPCSGRSPRRWRWRASPPSGRPQVAARAVAGTSRDRPLCRDWSWYGAVRALVAAERFDPALRELDRALDRKRARSAAIDAGGALAVRADLLLRTGKLARAEATALALREIARTCGLPVGDRYAVACLGEVLIERGSPRRRRAPPHGRPARGARPRRGERGDCLPAGACGSRRAAPPRRPRSCARAAPAPRRSASPTPRSCRGARGSRRRCSISAMSPRRGGSRRASSRTRAASALRARSASRFAWPRGRPAARRRSASCATPSPPEGIGASSAPARLPPLAPRCGARDIRRRPAIRSAPPSTSRIAAAPPHSRRPALAELHAAGARPRRRLTSGAGALTPIERRIAELAAAGRPNREIAEVSRS